MFIFWNTELLLISETAGTLKWAWTMFSYFLVIHFTIFKLSLVTKCQMATNCQERIRQTLCNIQNENMEFVIICGCVFKFIPVTYFGRNNLKWNPNIFHKIFSTGIFSQFSLIYSCIQASQSSVEFWCPEFSATAHP